MPNGFSFVNDLARHIGQTVTIFTTSGGQSGMGFTGVLVSVNANFVRLVTQIGPAPGCALGNCCDHDHRGNVADINDPCNNELAMSEDNLGGQRRINCNPRHGLGSIVDIPVDRIASFVHNAVGSEGWF